MKKWIVPLILAALTLSGCSLLRTPLPRDGNAVPPADDGGAAVVLPAPADEEPLPADKDDPGADARSIRFDAMNLEALPETVALWAQDLIGEEPATASLIDGNYTYILVSLGMRPTAGYSVEVLSIEENETGCYVVTIRETTPAPDDMVAEVITYPAAVVRIDQTNALLVFVNEDGSPFA